MQAGTCMLIGDDHAAIDRAEEAIHQALGCHIYKRKIFYRKEGFDAVRSHPSHPLQALDKAALLSSC